MWTLQSKFLRFAGLSGAGWLLDLAILISLVGCGIGPAAANVASSCTAALVVFLASRILAFEPIYNGSLVGRIALYAVYTASCIGVASVLIAGCVALASRAWPDASLVDLAAAAKIILTPPQLFLNFAVSRLLVEQPIWGQRT